MSEGTRRPAHQRNGLGSTLAGNVTAIIGVVLATIGLGLGVATYLDRDADFVKEKTVQYTQMEKERRPQFVEELKIAGQWTRELARSFADVVANEEAAVSEKRRAEDRPRVQSIKQMIETAYIRGTPVQDRLGSELKDCRSDACLRHLKDLMEATDFSNGHDVVVMRSILVILTRNRGLRAFENAGSVLQEDFVKALEAMRQSKSTPEVLRSQIDDLMRGLGA
ncbi:MAG: hypothetical protein AAF755_03880 [Pseudomonadota bacterium]